FLDLALREIEFLNDERRRTLAVGGNDAGTFREEQDAFLAGPHAEKILRRNRQREDTLIDVLDVHLHDDRSLVLRGLGRLAVGALRGRTRRGCIGIFLSGRSFFFIVFRRKRRRQRLV